LAVLLIATVLNTIPSIFQSLYWQTGMLVYLFPLIIFTVYVGLIGYSMRRKSKKSLSIFLLILSTLLAFIAGGCSQTFVVLQTGALFLVMGIGVLRSTSDFKRSALPLVVAGFLGSLIAMVITILSPGNAFREAYFPPHPDLFSLVKSSTINAFLYMGNYNFHQVTNIAIALVLPAVLAFTMHPTEPNPPTQPNPNSKRALIISLLLSPIVGFILIVFCFAPTIWGESVPLPPERAIIIPQFVLVCTAIYWAYHAGLAARHLHLPSKKMVASFSLILISISTIALLVFGPVKSIQRNVALIPEYRAYAAMWDSQNAELRAAKLKGEKVVTITALDTTRLPWLRGGTVGPDVNNWVNLAVAAYYGLDSITAVESP
jgi:MFS family permease